MPNHMKEKMKADLRHVPVFDAMPEQVFDQVIRHSHQVGLDTDQALFHRNEEATAFFYVVSGKVKLYRVSEDGSEKVIEVFGPGHLFAFTLLFQEDARYPVDGSALEPSEVVRIDSVFFRNLLKSSADLSFRIMGEMSKRIMKMVNEIDSLSLQTGSDRFASYILDNTTDREPVFQLEISKKNLASLLSVKPETLSRIIRCLSDNKVVSIEGKQVRVLDRDRLKSTVCHVVN